MRLCYFLAGDLELVKQSNRNRTIENATFTFSMLILIELYFSSKEFFSEVFGKMSVRKQQKRLKHHVAELNFQFG